MRAADVLIAGGGPAGAAAAIRLAEAGAAVMLVERTRGAHDKVCGEFLSAEAVALLDSLGVPPAALGALPIVRMRFASRRRETETSLPFPAMSLTRRRLDEALLARAAEVGATVLRGRSVRGFEAEDGGWRVRLDGGQAVDARDLVIATGKHDLRGHARPGSPQDDLVGFKLHLPAASTSPRDRVELIGLPGGYAGLQAVEGGFVNLCLLVPRRTVQAAGGWEGVRAGLVAAVPRMAELFAADTAARIRPQAIGRIPYGFVRREARSGIRWLGDQAAVIPSFSGDGMSIALWTGIEAAEGIVAGESADAFQARIAAAVTGQVGRATTLSRLMVQPWFQTAATLTVAALPSIARLLARRTRLQPVFAGL